MKSIDIKDLKGYEVEANEKEKLKKKYYNLSIVGGIILFPSFIILFITESGYALIGGLIGLCIVAYTTIHPAFRKVKCPRCKILYKKYRNKNLEPNVTLEHVYVCEKCKRYFKSVVAMGG